MVKKALTTFFLVFIGIQLNTNAFTFAMEKRYQVSMDSLMIVGIQSKENIPEVKSITLIKGRVNPYHLLCRDFPPLPSPGQNPASLLFLYNSTGEILFKTAFDYPIAKTVPPEIPGVNDPGPDVISIKEPEVYLPVPYFKETAFIEIYNPGEPFPKTVKEFDKNDIHVYHTAKDPLPTEEGKFHVLIIASGYSAANISIFTRKAEEFKSYLLSKEPFQTYAADIEVHIYENLEDLGCYRGCNGIERLMCCTSSKVISAAAASGYLFDEIIVLHDTDVYSGGGHREHQDAYKTNSYNSYTMSYSGTKFKQVALHEFGHSFGNLCDEYSYNSEGISYNSCVNCRDNCNIWSHITSTCQQGCSAKSDYYRPDNSIMLDLDLEYFNSVSLYATYLPDGLDKRLRFFIHRAMPVSITLQAARNEEKAWLIRRHYGEIDIIIDNPGDAGISRVIISRKDAGEDFQPIKEIPFPDLQNNSYSFIDKFLDKNITYTYRAEALDSIGKAIGTSNEETI
ncbi:MAG: hypothetical protein JSV88_24145 [Candidatus Aminicenantes bacterium]|nr:MAG: hypothetical protein JSV88_24145 [Candidatus Aminicenantes bacterium]